MFIVELTEKTRFRHLPASFLFPRNVWIQNDELIYRLFNGPASIAIRKQSGELCERILIENAYQTVINGLKPPHDLWMSLQLNLPDYYESVDLRKRDSTVSDWW